MKRLHGNNQTLNFIQNVWQSLLESFTYFLHVYKCILHTFQFTRHTFVYNNVTQPVSNCKIKCTIVVDFGSSTDDAISVATTPVSELSTPSVSSASSSEEIPPFSCETAFVPHANTHVLEWTSSKTAGSRPFPLQSLRNQSCILLDSSISKLLVLRQFA